MFFDEVLEAKPDPIFGLKEAFQADVRPNKVNLIIGIYKDEDLQPHLMPSVRKAKEQVMSQDLLADYLPLDGLSDFYEEIGKVAFGEKVWSDHRGRIYAAQTVGGTGALQVGGQLLSQEINKEIAFSSPTWPNHRSIFQRAGCVCLDYPYYCREKHGIDFDALYSAVEKFPEKTVILLHPVCHNPTGCDLTLEQWKKLSKLLLKRKLIPFFDCAYQGLGEGVEKDRQAIEIFFQDGHEMLIAYSCAKNFSLYCQRVGALFIVSQNAAVKHRVGSQVKKIIRSLYSNPPAYGARIAAAVLKDSALRKEWTSELEGMRKRIHAVREDLIRRLSEKTKTQDFEFLRSHKGMFSFIDLDKSQVQRLIDEFGIYMIGNGRMSLTGLNGKNIDSVVEGLSAVCDTPK